MPAEPYALVTGFEPFAGDPINPSALLAEQLDGQVVAGMRVRGVVLPVELSRLRNELDRLLESDLPSAVLSFGLATGRTAISLERVAVNALDFRIPDNAGEQVRDREIVSGGPAAYTSRLPLRAGVERLRAAGVPAYISNSAGLYLCNAWMYLLLHGLSAVDPGIPGGFVHVPCITEQVVKQEDPEPSVSLELLTQAACLLLETVLRPPSVSGQL